VRLAVAVAVGAAVLLAPLERGFAAEAARPAAKPAAPAPTPASPPPAARPPPYEPQLLRIAEMMGALAFLRELCGHGDGADFRGKMAALLAADGLDAQRRDLLAGAYNRGFQDYATSYRVCTPAAHAIIERYLAETARLAADLASRYGG